MTGALTVGLRLRSCCLIESCRKQLLSILILLLLLLFFAFFGEFIIINDVVDSDSNDSSRSSYWLDVVDGAAGSLRQLRSIGNSLISSSEEVGDDGDLYSNTGKSRNEEIRRK